FFFFFFSSRRRHTRSYGDWSSDVCSSDLPLTLAKPSAVRNRVEEGFAKVKGRMPPYSQPKIPRAPQGERKHQARDRDIGRTHNPLAGVSQVSGPKHERQAKRGRPEPHPSRESVLRISAK